MLRITIPVLLLSLIMGGCADRGKYYEAHQQREITRQLASEKSERQRAYEREQRELSRQAHRERMIELSSKALIAASKTENKIDDILVPYHLASLEDKWAIANMLAESKTEPAAPVQYDKIEAPENPSEYLRIGANLLLGGGAIYLGIRSSDNLVDVAVAGIENAGIHLSGEGNMMTNDSFKTGTDNTIGDSNFISSDDAINNPEREEELE